MQPDFTEFNDDDRQKLDKHRVLRLSQLPLFHGTNIGLIDGIVHISCLTAESVDRLLEEKIDVKWWVWTVAGSQCIIMWFANQQVWGWERGTETFPKASSGDDNLEPFEDGHLESLLSTVIIPEESDMTAATLDRPQAQSSTATQTRTKLSKLLPGAALRHIAEDMEQSVDTIRAWVQEHNYLIILFGGEEVIPNDVALEAYDHFTRIMQENRLRKRGLLTVAEPPIEVMPETAPQTNGKASEAAIESVEAKLETEPAPTNTKATRKTTAKTDSDKSQTKPKTTSTRAKGRTSAKAKPANTVE
ncbi:MAG TPA: hypothetical protein V6D10_07100 [Trichocoleus sp.]|jgi:hypothetical protein